ncbi:MAG TPA: response regulator [Bryobacteraceae bacterium]|nr:response regulator [Bryobacteraceae bacterium]
MDKRTVLLAEDNEMVRSFVRSVLERQGYRVLAAENGAEALALAKRVGLYGIDLILADVDMPLLSGIELVRRLKQLRPDLKILYMTGQPAAHGNELWNDCAVIEKPFAYRTLVRGVDACLSENRHYA